MGKFKSLTACSRGWAGPEHLGKVLVRSWTGFRRGLAVPTWTGPSTEELCPFPAPQSTTRSQMMAQGLGPCVCF